MKVKIELYPKDFLYQNKSYFKSYFLCILESLNFGYPGADFFQVVSHKECMRMTIYQATMPAKSPWNT